MNKAEWIRGKTLEQITNMPLKELEKLTESQLRTVVGRLVSAGNKRMRRMESAVMKNSKNDGGQYFFIQNGQMGTYQQLKFSTTGKDKEALLQEFKRASSFMKSEKTSLKGIRKIRKKSLEGLRQMGINIDNLSQTNYDRFWRAYDKLKELNPTIDEKKFKYAIIDKMSQIVSGMKEIDIEALINSMEQQLTEIYEEQEKLKKGEGTSGFFDVQY